MINKYSLKGKHILVSAGSTWVSIDTVRVITNIFKGKIGLTIATEAAGLGANVTLLLGPSIDISNLVVPKNLKIYRFRYFDELDMWINKLLRNKHFDAVIHSAAVSDFKVNKVYKGKIKSNTEKLILELIPTKKIVDNIKKLDPSAFLVKFKLEVGITTAMLIKTAKSSMKKSNADLIVANIYDPNYKDHKAYIVDKYDEVKCVVGKIEIAHAVLKMIYESF
jgi:phosphopantothenoylcysteine decarboxylase/phosphopantothenate--cysteine ligase